MQAHPPICFEAHGKLCEIRIFSDAWEFKVQAYHENKPINAFSYSASLPTYFDLGEATKADPILHLIELAKQDVLNAKWESCRDTYIKAHNLTGDEVISCPRCHAKSITYNVVDQRKMFSCPDCNHIFYETRRITGPYLMMMDEITDEVYNGGHSDQMTEVLLNTIFREESGSNFHDSLKNWCIQNHLHYSQFSGTDSNGDPCSYIRFLPDYPRSQPLPGQI